MIKQIIISILCSVVTISAIAQEQSIFKGKVILLNSGHQTVQGVKVSGEIYKGVKCRPVYTKSDGTFILRFPIAEKGNHIKLSVDLKDGNGKSLEIVNNKDLEICRIPENPKDVFEVIVCRKGQRDEAAQKYYKILKSSADVELAKVKKELDDLLNSGQQAYEKIQTLIAKIDRLEENTDSIKIYQEAFRIASINKDNASKRVLEYIQLLDTGKSIREAREVLNIEKATSEMDSSMILFNAAVEELELRASASKTIFDYEDAIECYDTIIFYGEKIKITDIKIANFYYKKSDVISNNGQYKKALSIHQKAIDLKEKVLGFDNSDLAILYSGLGHLYNILGKYKEALKYHEKALYITNKNKDLFPRELSHIYNNISLTYQNTGEFQKAFEYIKKDIVIQEQLLGKETLNLATGYDNLAINFKLLGNLDSALFYHQKAINIQEKISKKHPNLTITYHNIATTYQSLGKFDTALIFHKKDLKLSKEILRVNHPHLGFSYASLALCYENLGRLDSALLYHNRALSIYEKVFSPQHSTLVRLYGNMSITYLQVGEWNKAIGLQHKVIRLSEKANHIPYLAACYNNLASIYLEGNKLDSAKYFYLKSIELLKSKFGDNHYEIANTYTNIGHLYLLLDDLDSAFIYSKKSLDIRKKKLGLYHFYTSQSYNNIGLIYEEMRELKSALVAFKESLRIKRRIAVPPQNLIITYDDNIYKVYQKLNLVDSALFYIAKSISIREEQNINDKIPLAILYCEAGYLQSKLGNCDFALDLLEKSNSIFKENYKVNSYLLRPYYHNLGLIYLKCGFSKKAELTFLRYQLYYQRDIFTYINWAVFFSKKNQKNKALKYLKKAIDLGYQDIYFLENEEYLNNIKTTNKYQKLLRQAKK